MYFVGTAGLSFISAAIEENARRLRVATCDLMGRREFYRSPAWVAQVTLTLFALWSKR